MLKTKFIYRLTVHEILDSPQPIFHDNTQCRSSKWSAGGAASGVAGRAVQKKKLQRCMTLI